RGVKSEGLIAPAHTQAGDGAGYFPTHYQADGLTLMGLCQGIEGGDVRAHHLLKVSVPGPTINFGCEAELYRCGQRCRHRVAVGQQRKVVRIRKARVPRLGSLGQFPALEESADT